MKAYYWMLQTLNPSLCYLAVLAIDTTILKHVPVLKAHTRLPKKFYACHIFFGGVLAIFARLFNATLSILSWVNSNQNLDNSSCMALFSAKRRVIERCVDLPSVGCRAIKTWTV